MLLSSLSLASTALAGNLALYWGQNSAGSQKSLGEYCQNSPGDIYLISFLTTFGSGNGLAAEISGYGNKLSGTDLPDAPELGADIEKCQSMGKKVLLSMGGASGSYGFSSASDAEKVAEQLWNYFGGGTSNQRPFGQAKIDGFDLDGENQRDAQNYAPFVNKLRELYAEDSSKQYYVSAAPQCPYPDATVGGAISDSDLDFLFVQFYNNYCKLTGDSFNFDTWQKFASTSAPNKNVKVYVGLPGSSSAAGSGYASLDDIKSKYSSFASEPNFGGFMVWDASQAESNTEGGTSFAKGLQNLLGDSSSSPAPSSSSSAAPTTSSSSSSSSTSSHVWWTPSTSESTSSSSSQWAPETTSSSSQWTPETTSSSKWAPETTSSSSKWTPETTSSSKWTPETTSSSQWTPETTSSSKWAPETTSSSSKWTPETTSSSKWTPETTSSSQWTPETTSSSWAPKVTTSSQWTPETSSSSSTQWWAPSSKSTSPETEPTTTVQSTSIVPTTSQRWSTVSSEPTSTVQSTSTIDTTSRHVTTHTSAKPTTSTMLGTFTSNGAVYVYETVKVTTFTTEIDYSTEIVTL